MVKIVATTSLPVDPLTATDCNAAARANMKCPLHCYTYPFWELSSFFQVIFIFLVVFIFVQLGPKLNTKLRFNTTTHHLQLLFDQFQAQQEAKILYLVLSKTKELIPPPVLTIYCLDPKFCWTEKILGPKFFSDSKFLVQNFFWSEKKFRLKIFWAE